MNQDPVVKAVNEIVISTARGLHTMLDYIFCVIPKKNVESVALNLIFQFKIICEKEELRIVGEKCVVFDGVKSPPGFTFVLCLDESHISVHSYAEEGLLAVDCFTCSKNSQAHRNAIERIENLMLSQFPASRLYKKQNVARFLTPYQKSSLNQE